MLDPADIEGSVRAAVFEPIQHLSRLVDLSTLIVKDAESRVSAWPLGQQIYGTLELFRGLGVVTFQCGDEAEAPEDFSGPWNALAAFRQSFLCPARIVGTELKQGETEIVLVVVRIAGDGVTINFRRMGGITDMRVDIAKQSKVGIILLSVC